MSDPAPKQSKRSGMTLRDAAGLLTAASLVLATYVWMVRSQSPRAAEHFVVAPERREVPTNQGAPAETAENGRNPIAKVERHKESNGPLASVEKPKNADGKQGQAGAEQLADARIPVTGIEHSRESNGPCASVDQARHLDGAVAKTRLEKSEPTWPIEFSADFAKARPRRVEIRIDNQVRRFEGEATKVTFNLPLGRYSLVVAFDGESPADGLSLINKVPLDLEVTRNASYRITFDRIDGETHIKWKRNEIVQQPG